MIRGDVVHPAVVASLVMPSTWCTCIPSYFPDMLDADCPQHGLRALLEGRFDNFEGRITVDDVSSFAVEADRPTSPDHTMPRRRLDVGRDRACTNGEPA